MTKRFKQKEDYLSPRTDIHCISPYAIIAASELENVNGSTEAFIADQSNQLESFDNVDMGEF